jgi:hypothetical protein
MNDDDLFIRKLYTRCMFASMLALARSIDCSNTFGINNTTILLERRDSA